MIEAKKRREIITNWILKNEDYKLLCTIRQKLQNLAYNISWEGKEKYQSPRYYPFLNYESGSIESSILEKFSFKYYYCSECYKYDRRLIMYNDSINLSMQTSFLPRTLKTDWEKKDLREIKELMRKKDELVINLVSSAELLFETLRVKSLTLSAIKKYYPELL